MVFQTHGFVLGFSLANKPGIGEAIKSIERNERDSWLRSNWKIHAATNRVHLQVRRTLHIGLMNIVAFKYYEGSKILFE